MAKRLKTIKAGRLVVVGCYTIPTPRSTDRERAALKGGNHETDPV